MGPLVPVVFSSEFGLVIAFLIGIAFGIILEQAGFSSTKKLVGLFYGYDFTVLRVFFTAGITAMIGVLLLAHFSLINMDIIYINPAFVRSAIVGGLIMGAGFIIGGFCPGTSVCAAAIGKLDAITFIIGAFIGVFVFIETYPSFKDFYFADSLGDITFFEYLGISRLVFAYILTVIALLAFYFTWRIENKVNKRSNQLNPKVKRNYIIAIAAPVFVLLVITILPSRKQMIYNQIAKAKEQQKCVFREMSSDKLAYEITHSYYQLNIIDVRSPQEYKEYHLPLAINIPFEDILDREWKHIFTQDVKKNIIYADTDTLAKMSCLKARYIGDSENYILNESPQKFREKFFEIEPPPPDSPKENLEVYHFRSNAAQKMKSIQEALENIGKPVKRKVKKVQGGCQ